jgi:hypothetical protein
MYIQTFLKITLTIKEKKLKKKKEKEKEKKTHSFKSCVTAKMDSSVKCSPLITKKLIVFPA